MKLGMFYKAYILDGRKVGRNMAVSIYVVGIDRRQIAIPCFAGTGCFAHDDKIDRAGLQ